MRRKLRSEWHGFGGWRRFRKEWLLDRRSLLWEPRDLWLGAYWNFPNSARFDLYIALLPTLILRLSWRWIGR
jgi:hypothetical protein